MKHQVLIPAKEHMLMLFIRKYPYIKQYSYLYFLDRG
jgi:hypothetical protein